MNFSANAHDRILEAPARWRICPGKRSSPIALTWRLANSETAAGSLFHLGRFFGGAGREIEADLGGVHIEGEKSVELALGLV